MPIQIKLRRGTASEWTSSNPTLSAGEAGYETDTRKLKIGDGSSSWTALGYVNSAYDISGEIDGTPDGDYEVFHFKAVRSYTLESSGHAGGVVTAPVSTTTMDIFKNNTSTTIGTISITNTGVVSINITATGSTLVFTPNDVLYVMTRTSVNGISGLYFTFRASVS